MKAVNHPRQLMATIGKRLARERLARNITQATLARETGIALRTLRRLEAGQPSTLDTFLRVADGLGLAEQLVNALPDEEAIMPIERLDNKRKARQRARPKSKPPASTWVWGEGH